VKAAYRPISFDLEFQAFSVIIYFLKPHFN